MRPPSCPSLFLEAVETGTEERSLQTHQTAEDLAGARRKWSWPGEEEKGLKDKGGDGRG